MLIIGIDPGTINTGFGIINFDNNQFKYVHSGVITPSPKLELSEKLEIIYGGIVEEIKLYSPDEFALETAFYGKNVQSTLKIGYVRGISLLAAAHNNLKPGEYSPREIKKAVVGKGSATKEQIQFMVTKLVSLNKEKMKFDETDALAVAICHALKCKSPIGKSSNWKKYINDHPEKVI